MRLTKLKLAGFKSFVDPTTISFNHQVIGILGPNGCGKSNTIDAVRWVMGESSAKNLRGGQMADVIFNGSTSRKPASMASVELVFDNSEGKLGGEYRQYSEIALRREVTRDGSSNYYLNNTRCRRRDIGDVFLGTGLGPRGYTIIEQGMISKIIEAKPDELRAFVEEAAGISIYKKRRHDTELRIRHTRENLERLEDIREEQSKQLDKLERQAESAKKYNALKEQQLEIDVQLIALQSSKMQADVDVCTEKLRDLSIELEKRLTNKIATESDIERLRINEQERRDSYDAVHESFYGIGKKVAGTEQSISFAKERKQQLEQDAMSVEQSIADLQEDINSEQENNTILNEQLIEIEPQLEEVQNSFEQARTLLDESQDSMELWSKGWDVLLDKIQIEQRHADVKKVKIEQIEKEEASTQGNFERAKHELSTINIEELQEQHDSCEAQASEIDELIDSARDEIESTTNSLLEQRDLLTSATNAVDEKSLELHSLTGKHSSLLELQNAALNKQSDKLNKFLKNNNLLECSKLGESLTVESGWENSVEAVLRWCLDAICLDKSKAVDYQDLNGLDSTVMLMEPAVGESISDNSNNTRLSSKVSTIVELPWLETVFVADNIDEALQLRQNLKSDESVILRDGLWFGKNWVRSPLVLDNQEHGVLQRKARIADLEVKIEQIKELLVELKSKKQNAKDSIADIETALSQAQNERHEHSNKAQMIKSTLAELAVKRDQKKTRITTLHMEIEEFQMKKQELGGNSSELRQELEQHLECLEKLNCSKEELSKEKDALQSMLAQSRERVTLLHNKVSDVKIERERVAIGADASNNALSAYKKQFDLNAQKRIEISDRLDSDDDPVTKLQDELEAFLDEQLTIEDSLHNTKIELETVTQDLAKLESTRTELELQIDKFRELVETQKLHWQELKVRRETLDERVKEYDLEIDEIIKKLPDDANESEWLMCLEDINKRIARLGAINLAAIEEYDHEAERKTYLDTQYDDLIEALEILDGAIQKIDKETKSKFKETYDAIDQNFRNVFPKLFGGGRANLELVGDDLLDAGVTVMAQPPGKRNSSINLLSGGEKALSAVSLVFSIFQLNPAPFCMLDEVDAPLDDANVARFCELVKEMSATVQFILITHNKVTMELASQLCGVTMKEPGVSRIVDVNMEEALDMAEA